MPPPRVLPPLAAAAALAIGCAVAPIASPPPALTAADPLGSPRRTFTVPDQGALQLAVPEGWAVVASVPRPGEDGPPVTLRIADVDDRFTATLAPVGVAAAATGVGEARAMAARALDVASARSAERELALEALVADGAPFGFWFTATDRELLFRAPAGDEWRGLLQGTAVVGELLVGFTLLDDLPGAHRKAFLAMVAGARHLPPEPAGSGADARWRPASGLDVAWPGLPWTASIALPGALAEPLQAPAGGRVVARAEEPASGVRASISLRGADGAASAVACREPAMARARGAVGGIGGERVWEEGAVAHAAYFSPSDRGDAPPAPRWNRRAWFLRDGVCVEVHLTARGGPELGGGVLDTVLASLRFPAAR